MNTPTYDDGERAVKLSRGLLFTFVALALLAGGIGGGSVAYLMAPNSQQAAHSSAAVTMPVPGVRDFVDTPNYAPGTTSEPLTPSIASTDVPTTPAAPAPMIVLQQTTTGDETTTDTSSMDDSYTPPPTQEFFPTKPYNAMMVFCSIQPPYQGQQYVRVLVNSPYLTDIYLVPESVGSQLTEGGIYGAYVTPRDGYVSIIEEMNPVGEASDSTMEHCPDR